MRAVVSGQSHALRWLHTQGALLTTRNTQGITPLEALQALLDQPDLPLELRGRLLHTRAVLESLLESPAPTH